MLQTKEKEVNFFGKNRRDDWQTPPELFNILKQKYNFIIDLAASKNNSKCIGYYAEDNNSLDIDWKTINSGVCWLNPPFSKATEFFKKAPETRLVAIYKAANLETSLWQDIIIPNADWICFIKRRVNYLNHEGIPSTGVTFGSALIGYNVPCKVADLGRVWYLKNRGTK